MTYNISYDAAAVAILLCVLIIHSINKNRLILENQAFTAMVCVTLVAGIFDMLDIYGTAHPYQVSMFYHHFTSYGYFLAINAAPFTYAFYTITLRRNRLSLFSKVELATLLPPMVIAFGYIITNPLHHLIYYYDAQLQYFRGEGQLFLYFITVYYMLYGAIYTTVNRKNIALGHMIAVYLFLIIACGGSLIQLFIPQCYISIFAISICILIILLAIQKPNEGIDPKVGLYNFFTFSKVLQLTVADKSDNTLLLIYVEDVALMNQAIGVSRMDTILASIGKYLNHISKNHAFYMNGNVFGTMYATVDEEKIKAYVDSIYERFEKPWECDATSILMNCKVLRIRIPADVQTIEGVQAYKDYLKEQAGKDNFYIKAEDTAISLSKRRMEVEKAIKHAIKYDGFQVYYQPIYSTKEGKMTSAEALLRMNDPELGFVPPDEFITIAERTGSIIKIGEIVLKKVCRFIKEHDLQALGIEYVEVNLSVIQCLQEHFADKVKDILDKYGIKPEMINLEITETAANSSPKMLIHNMMQMYQAGISFSLDDFGSGYSNMGAILELPLDMIKFDKTLVDTMDKSQKGNIVFRGSVAMIKQMDMKIVAEGIETKEQKETMEALDIEFLQGYYFSRPVPENEFINYVKKYNNIDCE